MPQRKSLDRLVAALGARGVTTNWTGDQGKALCPGHDDSTPSLTFRHTGDRTVMFCHGPCDTPTVLDALGLALRDLYDEPRGAKLATYEYRDAAGTVVRKVHRRADKSFPQEFPAGKQAPVVLYRLAEVTAAVSAGKSIYLSEGEEDVHALESLGVVATTAPMGSKSFGKVDVSPLKGASVIAVPDQDGSAGQGWLADVAKHLDGVVRELVVSVPKVGKDASDHVAGGYGIEDFGVGIVPAVAKDSYEDGDSDDFDDDGKKRPSQATLLVKLARERYRLVIGDDGRPYAVAKNGPAMARPMRGSNGLRKQLARAYADATHGTAPSQSALADAMTVLEGYADDAHPEPIYMRVAPYLEGVAIDLGTPDGRCILADKHQWLVVDRAPVLFRRTNLTSPMREPTRGNHAGSPLRGMGPLLNLINADDERRKTLVGWLLAACIPEMPHPILSLFGEQGTAKSTATKLLMSLVDPSTAPLRSPPRDVRQWAITANASWTVPLDNVSNIEPWLSDLLCKAVTGDGHVDRALYSDDDVSVLKFRRCLAINGISLGALRGDLADRFLPVELDVIEGKNRKGDEEVLAAAYEAQPAVLGALLDLLVLVLAQLPKVQLDTLPRMADFARVLKALDDVTEWETLETYLSAAGKLADTVIDSDPFATALRKFLDEHGEMETSVAALLDAIPVPEPKPRSWPKTAQAGQGALARAAPALRQIGYTVTRTGTHDSVTRRALWSLKPAPRDNEEESEGDSARFQREGANDRSDPSDPSESQLTGPKDLTRDPSDRRDAAESPKDLGRQASRSFTHHEQQKRGKPEGSKDPNDRSHLLSGSTDSDLWADWPDGTDDYEEVRV